MLIGIKLIRGFCIRCARRVVAIFLLFVVYSCTKSSVKKLSPTEVAKAWADMTLYITKNTPANSPTFASRAFAYIGITMYESVVQGYPTHKSLAGQLNGLYDLPLPNSSLKYNWVLSLNSGQAYILKKIYQQTSEANKKRIDSLEYLVNKQYSDEVKDQPTIKRSVTHGRGVAEAIYQWSLADGGHRAYLHNFDKSVKWSTALGSWEPPLYGQSFSHYPLHPTWGSNRVFTVANERLSKPKMIGFDSSSSSAYYKQFDSVFQKNKSISLQEKEAALWWADDPGDTFTPPGHSYYLTGQILKEQKPILIIYAEAYARTGIAVADAFINCWKWKYVFFSERPSSFIIKHIDKTWESFWPDPPFPAFPSGHATQAAAVSGVLINLFGEKINLVDSAHVGRPRDELRNIDFKPRKFNSFRELADEVANSRFFGGIHTPQDNREGLNMGYQIAGNINSLQWRNHN
jgi:hypothetical protein